MLNPFRDEIGCTLVELLIAIALSLILILLAVPAWQSFSLRHRGEFVVNRLINAIELARSLAIQNQTPIAICPRGPQGQCAQDWNQGILLLDISQNNALRTVLIPRSLGELSWRSNLGQNDMLIFLPDGFTRGQFGTFAYTLHDDSQRYHWQIHVGLSGRVWRAP